MTTYGTDALAPKMDEACTETTEGSQFPSKIKIENKLWFGGIMLVVVNIAITILLVQALFKRQDGMARIGWAQQTVTMEGKERTTYMPVYMKTDDYKELGEK